MPTSTPPSQPQVIRGLPQDAAAVVRLLASTPVKRECPGSREDRYLDNLIEKPWGVEYRVYDDGLIDVWMLEIKAGERTSMHCHPRKDTVLLGVAGHGVMTTGDGRRIAIDPGVVLHIEQGAMHRSLALTPMILVEIETPRDKFDLLRMEDDHARRGTRYEPERHMRQLDPPLAPVPDVSAQARVRPFSADGLHSFGIERGLALRRSAAGLRFAIALDALGILRREIAIARPHELASVPAEETFLTIRSTLEEDSP